MDTISELYFKGKTLREKLNEACLMAHIFCVTELEFETMIISEPVPIKTRLQRLPGRLSRHTIPYSSH